MTSQNTADEGRAKIILHSFACSTSAHGIQKLVSPVLPVRVLWIFLILTAMGGFSFHLSTMVYKYLQKPVSTSIFLTGTDFIYPEITVCNRKNLAIGNMATKNDSGVSSTDFRSQSMVQWVWNENASAFFQEIRSFKEIIRQVFVPILDSIGYGYNLNITRYLKIQDEFLHNLAGKVVRDSYGPEKTSGFHLSIPEMVIQCQIGAQHCDYNDLSEVQVAGYLTCTKFNWYTLSKQPRFKNIKITDDFDLVLYTASNFLNSVGLSKQTEEATDDYLRVYDNGGIDVFIHKPGTYPTSGLKIAVSNGYKATITVKYSVNENINSNENPCVPEYSQEYVDYYIPTVQKTPYFKYKYGDVDCENIFHQKRISEKCECFDYEIPIDVTLKSQKPTFSYCANISQTLEASERSIPCSNRTNSSVGVTSGTILRYFITTFKLRNDTFSDSSAEYLALKKLFRQHDCLILNKVLAPEDDNSQCLRTCTYGYYTHKLRLETWPQRDTTLLTAQVTRLLESSTFYRNGEKVLDLNYVKSVNRALYDILVMGSRGSNGASDNFVKLKIKVGDLTAKSYVTKENLSYNIEDLFSDLGGILGLYVGVSVLTLCEFFELILSLVVIASTAVKHKKANKVNMKIIKPAPVEL